MTIGCGDASAPLQGGPVIHTIVSGQNQVSVAGAGALAAPVIERLTRSPSGKLELHRFAPARLLDLLVPRAYAQTDFKGSPVSGAVVCAGGGDGGLTPFAPCTNTDDAGKAALFFTPSTVAGEHTAEIRGAVDGEPAVFDTARALVVPDAVDTLIAVNSAWVFTDHAIPVTRLVERAADRFGNPVATEPSITNAWPLQVANDSIRSDSTEHSVYGVAISVAGLTAVNGSLVTSVRDLRNYTWQMQGRCSLVSSMAYMIGDAYVDSVAIDVTSETVTYANLSNVGKPVPQFHWHGTRTWFLRDGTTHLEAVDDTAKDAAHIRDIDHQAPAALYTYSNQAMEADTTAASPTYVIRDIGAGCGDPLSYVRDARIFAIHP